MSFLSFSFLFSFYFLARFIAVVFIVLYMILALWPPVLQFSCPRCFLFFYLLILFLLFVLVLSGEPKQKQGRGLVDRKLVEALPTPPSPSNFFAGRPKAALLFWFLGDFRRGVLLFMVIFVIHKYKNR